MNTIYIDSKNVPAHLRNGYAGNKFKALVCEDMTIPAHADLWDGGSRDRYQAVELATGRVSSPIGFNLAPWDKGRGDIPVTLRPGFAVVEHSIFCGKDMGLTFYVHPADAAAMLPAPTAELTQYEKIVLDATCGLKSSYNGKDRYQMKRDEMCWGPDPKPFMTRDDWNAAKDALIAKGLLNKAGAVTVSGRNARVRT